MSKCLIAMGPSAHHCLQDKACSAMEIFDELVESEVAIVTPHVKLLVEFCLQVMR